MLEFYKPLCYAIVLQAAKDLEIIVDSKANVYGSYNEGKYSKKELEQFFNSEWCDLLLYDVPFTGKDIYNKIMRGESNVRLNRINKGQKQTCKTFK